MVSIYKAACLMLMVLAVGHAGLSAQVARAPLTRDAATVPSKTANGLP